MAVFGKLDTVKQQVDKEKFEAAFKYLERVLENGTEENRRLLSLPLNAFEKVDLNDNSFGLEQVYYSKNRDECFFESHREYIDVQFILEGEESIEVMESSDLAENFAYDENIDLIKYGDTKNASIIKLRKGDVAIFYPEDAHMPCIRLHESVKVVKTVVKVKL